MVEQWRGGVIANKEMRGYSRIITSSGASGDDENLYGGGKYGAETR